MRSFIKKFSSCIHCGKSTTVTHLRCDISLKIFQLLDRYISLFAFSYLFMTFSRVYGRCKESLLVRSSKYYKEGSYITIFLSFFISFDRWPYNIIKRYILFKMKYVVGLCVQSTFLLCLLAFSGEKKKGEKSS